MIEFDHKELGVLNELVKRFSDTLQQAVNNGYRPEWREDLELYAKLNQKLACYRPPKSTQWQVKPPSITSSAPVIYADSSLAKNKQPLAISSGLPIAPKGISEPTRSIIS